MSHSRVIVVKFGGSVLSCESDLGRAVHEIYRWRRDGWRVVAVVSAIAGGTDALLHECERLCADPDPYAVAAHLAHGELQCAAKLGLFLDRAGISSAVLHPAAVQLTATGAALDAAAVSVDAARIEQSLARDGVVVLPGFVAIDASGRTVVLGRGGSDLTALFLARILRADVCRLIKDVDGLYESDPNNSERPPFMPRRFELATFTDALATDGSIVQHKAVRYALEHSIAFELGSFNEAQPTHIGTPCTRLVQAPAHAPPWRVALLGLGTVGAGVYQHLSRLNEQFEIASIAVRHVHKKRDVPVPQELLTDDAVAAASAADVDLVIELMGGTTTARHASEAALSRGAHVVTANKALLAEFGPQLHALAAASHRGLHYAASVGGSVPILEHLAQDLTNPAVQIRGVLNGTSNFVLNRLARGTAFNDAVIEAQQRGFAEPDPTRDLIGLDAADKLVVLAQALGYHNCNVNEVAREPLDHECVERVRQLAGSSRALRHVATLQRTADGIDLAVRLEALDRADALFDVPGERNAAVIQRVDGVPEVLRGRGAGRWPTAEAVLADVLTLARTAPPWQRRTVEMDDSARRVGFQASPQGPRN